MDVAIRAAGLRRTFGTAVAVENIDLAVPRGSVTALVGPNGAGKTTLMLMLAGLLAPDSGTLEVAGGDPCASAAVRTRIGWMPDNFGTWESLTCRELLTTFGAAYRIPPAGAAARAAELLEVVALTNHAETPAHALSRGQKQRLGLARTLMNSPEVLLLDEPASGMDPRSRHELRRTLRGLAAGGVTVLISSHVLAELDEMVDGAVFVERGRSVAGEALVASARRRWRVSTLDPDALASWAAAHQVALTPAESGGGMLVDVADESTAARLLADLVTAGVPVTAFGPAGSALEQAYLALDGEAR